MKKHTSNYIDTFIEVLKDLVATEGEIPPMPKSGKTVARMQYDILNTNPYIFTSDEVLFRMHAERNAIPESEMEEEKEFYFSKGQPCFRPSPLTKRYGWGIHFDSEGRMALVGLGTDQYEQFRKDEDLKVIKAMRSRRK